MCSWRGQADASGPAFSQPGAPCKRARPASGLGFYGAAIAPDLKHPATGDLIVLAEGEQLWRIDWSGNPVLVVTAPSTG